MTRGRLVLAVAILASVGAVIGVAATEPSGPPTAGAKHPTTTTTVPADCLAPTPNLASVVASDPAGSTITLCAGTFDESATPVLKDGDTLIGAGQAKTILTVSFAPSNVIDAHKAANASVEDLTVEGAKAKVGGSVGQQWGRGIWIGPGDHVAVVTLQDNQLDGIAGGAQGVVVYLDTFTDNGTGSGFDSGEQGGFKDTGFATIVDSVFKGNGGYAIWCDVGCAGGVWTVEGDQFVGNVNGIRYEISNAGALVEDNTITGNVKVGITLASSGNATVEDNSVTGGTVAIEVDTGDRPPGVSNDLIENNSVHGLKVLGCALAGVTCSGNS